MNIVYATSDAYSRLALISIKSLLMNNRSIDEINIYYIGNDLSEKNKRLISDLTEEYDRNITFIDMPIQYKSMGDALRTNAVVYSYCFLQDILPDTVTKVLLLESDTIVTDRLDSLYQTNITGYYLAATDDMVSGQYRRKLGMNESSPYFNAGVMLMNLDEFRKCKATIQLSELIKSRRASYIYEVQDELNVFCEGKVKILPPEYNSTTWFFIFNYRNLICYKHPSTYCTEEEYRRARNNPRIIHYTKTQFIQSHPWKEDCEHLYRQQYFDVKAQTVLSNEPLWKVKKKWSQKIISFVYKTFPDYLTASFFGTSFLLSIRLAAYKVKRGRHSFRDRRNIG